MWTAIRRSVDRWLWRRHFRDPLLRGPARRGILITAFALVAGGLLAFRTDALFWFGVGSLLAVWNFCALTGWTLRLLAAGWSRSGLISLLLHTNIRLFLTGFLLYICIVWCKASLFPLITGLTLVVIDVTLSGLINITTKRREPDIPVSTPAASGQTEEPVPQQNRK